MGCLERRFGEVIRRNPAGPRRIALDDPWGRDELTHRYSDPSRALAVPGFGLEINRALYMDGVHPVDEQIRALNRAFTAFITDAVELLGGGD